MCGITGFSNLNETFTSNDSKWKHIIEIMANTINHRGPDERGSYLNKKIGLGHRRLSIRDIDRGSQPMIRTFGDREYAICYNGEIYNTNELSKDLIAKGYSFQTTSDTEIILVGLAHYGPDFVSHLNGIFAIAFWDNSKETLLLIRDRVGVKPLFYTNKDEYLIFGSEMKAIFQFPGIRAKVDEQGLQEIFAIGPAKTPGIGVYKDFYEVLPGHYIKYDHNGLSDITYWTLESHEHTDYYDDTVEHVRVLLKDSVERQMVADVPVCSFLSGGVDSSIVTAYAANYLRDNYGKKLTTFSFDFTGNREYFKGSAFQPDQDRPWAEKMASFCETDHIFLECNNEILADYLEKAVDAKDLPGMADVESSLLYFCEQVQKTHKVALTGECADEIFGGYPWFYKQNMFDATRFPWSSDMDARTVLLKDDMIKELALDKYAKFRYDQAIDQVPALASDTSTEKRRRELAYLNKQWFMATLLGRMDRTSMSAGLEARVPFADHRIIEYVFNVPWSMKYRDNSAKHLLRKSAEDLIPTELLYRKKSPYPKTYNPHYEKIINDRLLTIMSNKNEPIHNFLAVDKVNSFIQTPSNTAKPWYGQLMAGPQMVAYMLQVNYWLKQYKVELV